MVVAELPRSRVDEEALGAGTTVRFALLLVLVVVASGLMMFYVAFALSGRDDFGCTLAAGVDPIHATDHAIITGRAVQWEAWYACTIRYAPPPPWWVPIGWLVLLSATSCALFLVLPAWKARRGRVVPLETIDGDGELRRMLADLAATAGLTRVPRVVVDPVAASTGAVVFGRNRRPIVCLHGGLLARRHTDPQGFRAVLLHEFAHIRNGDVTITYLTVAVWRVFLGMALPPFLAWCVAQFALASQSPWWSVTAPMVTRGLLLVLVMVVLVYLARSDALRSREIYADLAALRWGADPHGWAIAAPKPPGGTLRRTLGSFVELWRTHPRWELRRDALADPAVLFGVRGLPMFLTGTAASVISTHVWFYLARYILLSQWMQQAVAVAVAGLITGVVGIALWRAVAHAVLTSRRIPSGLRTGVWLGSGMVAGGLVAGQGTVNQWLPRQPAVFMLVVLVAVVFTWWTAQCALLWVSVWRGRTIYPVMLLGLAAACAAQSLWFVWWQTQGVAFAAGWSFNIAGARDMQLGAQTGPAAGNPALPSAVDVASTVTHTVAEQLINAPLALVAIAALWVVPLLAWTLRARTAAPRWARAAMRDTADMEQPLGKALPTLRRLLLPALLAGMLCWAAVVGVQAYLHTRPLPAVDYAMAYVTWGRVSLVTATAVAALTASALASHYRLLAALIAGETAALVGLAGTAVLISRHGCTPPLVTHWSICGWRPALTWTFNAFLAPTLVLGAITAIAAAAVVSVLRRTLPWARRRTPACPSRKERSGMVACRACVGVLCVAAMGIAATKVISEAEKNSRIPDPADVQRVARQLLPVADDAPVPAQSRAQQVAAWSDYGGQELMDRFNNNRDRLFIAVREYVESGKSGLGQLQVVRPLCIDIGRTTLAAIKYFRVPDPQTNRLWKKLVTQAGNGTLGCVKALDQQNVDLFNASIRELANAETTVKSIEAQIDAVIHAGNR